MVTINFPKKGLKVVETKDLTSKKGNSFSLIKLHDPATLDNETFFLDGQSKRPNKLDIVDVVLKVENENKSIVVQ